MPSPRCDSDDARFPGAFPKIVCVRRRSRKRMIMLTCSGLLWTPPRIAQDNMGFVQNCLLVFRLPLVMKLSGWCGRGLTAVSRIEFRHEDECFTGFSQANRCRQLPRRAIKKVKGLVHIKGHALPIARLRAPYAPCSSLAPGCARARGPQLMEPRQNVVWFRHRER